MPSPRTYQAIGFLTYRLGRRELRRREPELRRIAIRVALVALAILGAAIAARGDDERPLP